MMYGMLCAFCMYICKRHMESKEEKAKRERERTKKSGRVLRRVGAATFLSLSVEVFQPCHIGRREKIEVGAALG